MNIHLCTIECYRVQYTQHQKLPNSNWKDLIFELDSYLQGCLSRLINIRKFGELENLVLTDQIMRRSHPEIKDRFICFWAAFKEPVDSAS